MRFAPEHSRKLFGEAKFGEFMDARFLETSVSSPEGFAAFLKTDRERSGQVIKAAKQGKR